MVQQLNGISEIRTFFRTNTQPIYFVGPTAFNLLGIDRWVRNFQYVVYYDSWDGGHPRVFAPSNQPYVEFESSEQISNYLLRDPEVQAHLKKRGGTPMIVMVFFDEETEEICRELGYHLIMPSDELRRRLDEIADRAGELAPNRKPLQKPQDQQEKRGAHTDLFIGRQNSNRPGGEPHQHHGVDEDKTPAEPIPEVSEHDAAYGAHGKAGSEQAVGADKRCDAIFRRKEDPGQNRRQQPIDPEIVPFEEIASDTGAQHRYR